MAEVSYDELDELIDAVKQEMKKDDKFRDAIKGAVQTKSLRRLEYLVKKVAEEIYGIVTDTVKAAVDWCTRKFRELFGGK